MPAEHASQITEDIIDRIMTGRDNTGTLINAARNGDKSYFRLAVAPLVAQLEDDKDEAIRQRNEVWARLHE